MGEQQMYKRILIERYGQEMWDYWQSEKRKTVQYSDYDYQQISKLYLRKTKELLRAI
jgi:hypothetical protein